MPLTKYINYIKHHVDLGTDEIKLLKNNVEIRQYKKGETIHKAGQIFEHSIFINYGIVRSYVIDSNGKDFTWDIHFNDDNSDINNVFVVDGESFITKQKSRLTFEVLQDCELVYLNVNDLESLYKISKNAERIGRIFAEQVYVYFHKKLISKITKTAIERYADFVRYNAYLLDKVPQYHIATYLGIAPQSLSRIKNIYHEIELKTVNI